MASARIVHVCSGLDIGGAERHLLSLTKGLVDAGFQVDVAYLKGEGELVEDFRAVGCGVRRIGIRADVDPVGFLNLYRYLRAEEFDLLHGHLFHGNVYGVTAGSLAGIRNVVSSKHNDPPFWGRQPYKLIHNASLRQVDQVITISENVREYLLETTTVGSDVVKTIRYGLNPAPFDRVSAEQARETRRQFAEADQPLVGTVARLTEQKNLDTLLSAFHRLSDVHAEARLVIVGRGEREAALRELASDLDIDDRVAFAGFRDDVPVLMRAIDVFALPSKWEGFGRVFLEAMASRTPVVASAVSAIPEVVVDGETGVLINPYDVDEVADAISMLIEDPDLATRLGRQGRERLETHFSVERMVEETVGVYERLLTKS